MAMRKYGTAQDPHVEVEAEESPLSKEASREWTSQDEADLQGETED